MATQATRIGMPWGKGILLVSVLSLGYAFSVPFLHFWVLLGLLTAAAVALLFSREVFEYGFRIAALVLGATALFTILKDANSYPSAELGDVIARLLKILSLLTIMLDGWFGARFAMENKTTPDSRDSGLMDHAIRGSTLCLVCALVLMVFLIPNVEAKSRALLPGELGKVTYSVLLNAIAILPVFVYFYGNFQIVRKGTNLDTDYVYRVCRDYLWYVNIPGLLCSATMFTFAYILYSLDVPATDIGHIISGGMTFLVFSAVLIGVKIELEHQQLASARAHVTASPPATHPNTGG